MVNPNFFSMWKNKVPSIKINKLMTSYGPLVTFTDLESQLLFIYKERDFHKEKASDLLEWLRHIYVAIWDKSVLAHCVG